MKYILSILYLLLITSIVCAANKDAVICIPSHGASATVIFTERGRSLILGCGHAYEGQDKYKRMVIDLPKPTFSSGKIEKSTGSIKLVKVDYANDLSLVEVGYGPLPNVCKVAPVDYVIKNKLCLSVGYDSMIKPQHGPQMRQATIREISSQTIFTYEKPWHGRSGGALISDNGEGYLIGVVQGYELIGFQRGRYVSHKSILNFIGWTQGNSPQPSNRLMNPFMLRSSPNYSPNCPGGNCPRSDSPRSDCPNGICPFE